uniref:AlNc14C298G10344 protein n=1 Tax=Albugo laibachii Nc14 TaxID=890382 RepID=F0WVK9_9STRA|nr:AlNc14C298G10344 [Albugo laibachii Nc14]|eukprot:CCA25451.1 AlNc14C298G10344 [Albugo laibachii Nc14]
MRISFLVAILSAAQVTSFGQQDNRNNSLNASQSNFSSTGFGTQTFRNSNVENNTEMAKASNGAGYSGNNGAYSNNNDEVSKKNGEDANKDDEVSKKNGDGKTEVYNVEGSDKKSGEDSWKADDGNAKMYNREDAKKSNDSSNVYEVSNANKSTPITFEPVEDFNMNLRDDADRTS